DRIATEGLQIEHLQIQTELPPRDTGEIQQIIDQVSFHLDVLTNHREVCSLFLGERRILFLLAGEDEHRAQWGAQFMLESGDEVVLRSTCRLGRDPREIQLLGCNLVLSDIEVYSHHLDRLAGVIPDDSSASGKPPYAALGE